MLGSAAPTRSPFAAFRHRDFRLFQAGRFLSTVGMQMQGVAVGWQIYALTGQALDLGYVGLAQFLPAFLCSPLSGQIADRFARRVVLVVCHGVLALCALALYLTTLKHGSPVLGIYAVLVCIGAARGFAGPSAQALIPNLVPNEHFQNAVAWSSSIWQVAVVVGPALGGLSYAASGAGLVYALTFALELCAL